MHEGASEASSLLVIYIIYIYIGTMNIAREMIMRKITERLGKDTVGSP